MNGWDSRVVRGLFSGAGGAYAYGQSQQTISTTALGSAHAVAFVSTGSTVAQQAFSVAIALVATALVWLLLGLAAYLVRRALKKP
jgi:hypothetical protein